MSTIVTQNFKKELMIGTIRSINNTTENYYIGVSRSNSWNAADSAPAAKDNVRIQNEFRNGLQSIHRVAAAALVVPRKSWTTGSTYVAYDDKKDLTDYGSDFFYVVNNKSRGAARFHSLLRKLNIEQFLIDENYNGDMFSSDNLINFNDVNCLLDKLSNSSFRFIYNNL